MIVRNAETICLKNESKIYQRTFSIYRSWLRLNGLKFGINLTDYFLDSIL